MFNQETLEVIKIVAVTFLFTALIMPFMKNIAHYIGAVDVPRNDEGKRHIHKKPIPKLGGIGIFLGFLFGFMLFGKNNNVMNSVLIGGFILILTGLIDDIHSIKARHKFLGQTVAALIIVFYGGLLLDTITAFGLPTIYLGIWAYPVTIFFILGCINIISLIDGLDGLSSGISSIFYLTAGIICIFQGRFGSIEFLLTFIMLGSSLGFLFHNFYPAKIFAGDCAMFMGFMIGVISLLGFKGMAFTTTFLPLMIVGIPILDTLFAIIRRLLKGMPPFAADKEHLHHQILGMNFSQRTTVLIIYFIDGLFALTSILYVLQDAYIAKIIYVILFIIFTWFVLFTNIITDKKILKLRKK